MINDHIFEIKKSNRPIIPNTLSSKLLQPIDIYEHIRQVFHTIAYKAAGMNIGRFAIGVPIFCSESNELIVDFPVFVSNPDAEDEDNVAKGKMNSSIEGTLNCGFNECFVGLMMKYFSGEYIEDKFLGMLNVEYNKCNGSYIMEVNKPKDYEPYYTESSNDNTIIHYFRPILIDGIGLIGGIGVDSSIQMKKNGDGYNLLITIVKNIEKLIQGLCSSYYTQLDEPSDELRKLMTSSWKWDSRGRVLTGSYLKKIGTYIDNREKERVSLGGKGKALVYYSDCNGIKQLNDTFSHAVGNEVIRMTGSVLWQSAVELRKKVCPYCFVVRWGGDEFVVVIPLTNDENSAEIDRQFRNLVGKNLSIAVDDLGDVLKETHKTGKLSDYVSLALGWSEWNRSEDREFQNVWSTDAEKAMYCCKSMMKFQNQITISENRRVKDKKDSLPLISVASISLKSTEDVNAIIKKRLGVINYQTSSC